MTIKTLKTKIKRNIEHLDKKKLLAADEFISFLSEKESVEATNELINIPGFKKRFRKAMESYKKGEWVDYEKIKRNV